MSDISTFTKDPTEYALWLEVNWTIVFHIFYFLSLYVWEFWYILWTSYFCRRIHLFNILMIVPNIRFVTEKEISKYLNLVKHLTDLISLEYYYGSYLEIKTKIRNNLANNQAFYAMSYYELYFWSS